MAGLEGAPLYLVPWVAGLEGVHCTNQDTLTSPGLGGVHCTNQDTLTCPNVDWITALIRTLTAPKVDWIMGNALHKSEHFDDVHLQGNSPTPTQGPQDGFFVW